MIRIGGGWDTLSNFLGKLDPCRKQQKVTSSTQFRLILTFSIL